MPVPSWSNDYIEQKDYIQALLAQLRNATQANLPVVAYQGTEPTQSDFETVQEQLVGGSVLPIGAIYHWYDPTTDTLYNPYFNHPYLDREPQPFCTMIFGSGVTYVTNTEAAIGSSLDDLNISIPTAYQKHDIHMLMFRVRSTHTSTEQLNVNVNGAARKQYYNVAHQGYNNSSIARTDIVGPLVEVSGAYASATYCNWSSGIIFWNAIWEDSTWKSYQIFLSGGFDITIATNNRENNIFFGGGSVNEDQTPYTSLGISFLRANFVPKSILHMWVFGEEYGS